MAVYSNGSSQIPGDLNGDGDLTFADISIMYGYVTGSMILDAQSTQNADFNCDGEVDFRDICDLYAACINAA